MPDNMKSELSASEMRFLRRQIRNRQNYLYFSVAGVVAALSLAIYYFVSYGAIDGARFALIVMILLGARGNLKQHKDAYLLNKLSGGSNES